MIEQFNPTANNLCFLLLFPYLQSMASHTNQLHFLLIPLMSQSHIIPLTDFAKLLAQRGLVVSVVTTPRNAARYQPIVDRARISGLDIRLIPLHFPGHDFGLPKGCENMDTLSSPSLAKPFFDACELLEEPLEKLMTELEPRPSCVISTSALPWTQLLAQKFNIPRYVFQTVSCFTVQCSKRIAKVSIPDSDSFVLPDVPHNIVFTKSELPEMGLKTPDDIKSIIDYIRRVESLARGVLLNTFEELEPWYVEEYKKSQKNVWCVGPVSLCNKQVEDKIDRGNKMSTDDGNLCLKWLDSMPQKSVIYACFGSLCHLSAAQIREIGLGLEASGHPFVWIIREMDYTPEVSKWLKDDKFEERVKPFGVIIRGWAPQVLILSHPSIGGFLSHCGWNSTLEGLCAGVPMITWPMFAEQFYNEKFVVDVLRVGVRVGAKGVMKFGEEEKVLVKREKIKEAIKQLMGEDEESEERRKRAKILGEKANKSTEKEGSSYFNISLLIEDVKQLQQKEASKSELCMMHC